MAIKKPSYKKLRKNELAWSEENELAYTISDVALHEKSCRQIDKIEKEFEHRGRPTAWGNTPRPKPKRWLRKKPVKLLGIRTEDYYRNQS